VFTANSHDDHDSPHAARPPVLCVHGVGVGAGSFLAVRELLQEAGFEVSTPVRPAARPLREQLDAVCSSARQSGATPPVWAGVSGGATLGVLALVEPSVTLSGAVLHEPLVGSLTDDVRQGLARRAAATTGEGPAEVATRFVRELVGSAVWSGLAPAARSAVASRASEVLAESATFVQFEPDPDRLRSVDVPVLVTVGERSPSVRHDAARRVADGLGWSVRVVPGCSHLAQVESPDEFAAIVGEFTTAATRHTDVASAEVTP
jgi:pimeloyl-ACP methyl ester carboxylesterase